MTEADRGTQKPLTGDAALVRAVGQFALTAAVINVIVGGGIFRMPAALAQHVGSAAPLALLAGALAIVPVALCFAAVGSRTLSTGGPYTYVSAVFGPFAGFIAGSLMWISNLASSAGVAAAFSIQIASFIPFFASPLPRAALLTALYAVLFGLNAFGVKLGARAIATVAALKLIPLFLLAGIGAFWVDWTQVRFHFDTMPSRSALGASMVLVMFAYSGMETALVPSGEVKDPSRNVPRATMAAVFAVVLLYLGLQVVAQGLLGDALAKSMAPLADTVAALWPAGRPILLLTACVSMFGFLMGNLFGTSRLVFALGREGYLPRAYAQVSSAHRVPLLALVTHAAIAWVLALLGTFDALALISGGAICLVYLLVCSAAWRAQQLDLREREAPFTLWFGPLIPALALMAMLGIVSTLSAKEWLAIGLALAFLVVAYLVTRMLRRERVRG
jgi:basic amino acid/polyamine antiporter, APA family